LEYERRSKKAFKLVIVSPPTLRVVEAHERYPTFLQKVSSQVFDNDLMRQIVEANRNRYRACTFDTCHGSFVRIDFDSHPVFSAPIDVATGAFDRAEVETTPSEFSGGLTSTYHAAFRYGLIAHAEGPFTLGLHGLDASLPDMLANSSRTVLVDADDSADRGEMFSPFRLFPRA
jgi:hypothetical protein